MHICKKKQGIVHKFNQIGDKKVISGRICKFTRKLSIFRPDLDNKELPFIEIWTKRSCLSSDAGQTNVFLLKCKDNVDIVVIML